MSEEAQETSNKVYRKVRENHTRKMNRHVTTEDLIHNMFVLSDPLVSLKRGLPKHKQKTLPDEVLSLLVPEKTFDQIVKEETEKEKEEDERKEEEEEEDAEEDNFILC